jgi:hypothetical protein
MDEKDSNGPDGLDDRLLWSAWMPLMAAHPLALAQLPSYPGWLRVRRSNDPEALRWVGWAPQGVRQTAERLSRQVHLPVAPYDDPAIPALALWREKKHESAAFEVSGALPTPRPTDD